MDVEPADHGFGLFGGDFGYPEGGLCLSAFLAVEREGRVLVGSMDAGEADEWTDRWAPNLAYYEGKRRERLFEGWRLPATYLRVGEDPAEAAARVWEDQLGFAGEPDLSPVEVVSSSKPSRRSPQAEHWDVLFLYRAGGPSIDEAPAHWRSLDYAAPGELEPDESVMMHGELLGLAAPS